MPGYQAFYKGLYHTGKDPFKDSQITKVANNEDSMKRGTYYYVTKLIQLKEKYNLNY